MKVLHISYNDYSGAGYSAYKIHKSLLAKGIDSTMLVLQKRQVDDTVQIAFKRRMLLYRMVHFALRKLGIFFFEYDKLVRLTQIHKMPYTRPVMPFKLENHPLVKSADIIHLHWVDDFFNQVSFFKYIKKPIVWTIHDEALFWGISHYHDSVLEKDPLELKYRTVRAEILKSSHNVKLVFLSRKFADTFKNHPILQNKKPTIIYNIVDVCNDSKVNIEEEREKLGISKDTIVLAFVARNICDRHKGLNNLLNALKSIPKKVIVLAIGEDKEFNKTENVKTIGLVSNENELLKYYKISDFYVMPSLQESFSQSAIESISCGIPAILTPTGISEEIITKENGVLCKGFLPQHIEEALQIAFNRDYIKANVMKSIADKFSSESISNQYIQLYNSMMQ